MQDGWATLPENVSDLTEQLQGAAKEYYSKSDYDFSTPEGWDEYLNDKVHNPPTADGAHRRDFVYKPIGGMFAGINSTREIQLAVRGPVVGLPYPAGVLHVYYPNASYEMTVSSFFVGASRTGLPSYFRVSAFGPTENDEIQVWMCYWLAERPEAPDPIGALMDKIPPGTEAYGEILKALKDAADSANKAARFLKPGPYVVEARIVAPGTGFDEGSSEWQVPAPVTHQFG
ncbi:hypothetical protein [Paracoccus zhejiangensis]|uniref:Uncharacterized protein n=1 Tax=Paracoccus zhejiangensis TaxID=1077935 RepID=A0A2H5F172_9RHOB|nr:hypothetical protein [Paracoccus zhejiangensis]AUH65277.1 hypothetical protein CX676_14815 [Paracoccus zhejiangensis]